MSHQSHTWYDRTFYIYYLSLYGVWSNLVTLVEETYHALKIKIIYTPHISATPTLGVRNNMLSIHPKMFYSYTGNRHKNKFIRINAPNYCKSLSWKVLITEKEAWAMQKLFIKRKGIEKNRQVSEILKTMGTQMPAWKKREMNKIAHVFLQSVFQVSIKRDMFQGI